MLGLTLTSPLLCLHLGSSVPSARVSKEHHLPCESYKSLPAQRYTLCIHTSTKGLPCVGTSTCVWAILDAGH